MKPLNGLSLLLVAAVGLMVPRALGAQGARVGETPGRPTTDQQMSGEAFFYQNCTFCHEHSNAKRRLIPQFLGPTLVGLYESRPELSDDYVRALVRMGIPTRMPGFQYTLTSQEIDDLIAYLKIR